MEEKKVNLEVTEAELARLKNFLAGKTDDRPPLPEDAVPVGAKVSFWHMDRACELLKTKGYFKILTGLKHFGNAGGLMRRLDDKFRGIQENKEPGPCTGIEFFGIFEPKILKGYETKGINIMVRKAFFIDSKDE
jgi:hypothetical protein